MASLTAQCNTTAKPIVTPQTALGLGALSAERAHRTATAGRGGNAGLDVVIIDDRRLVGRAG